MLAFVFPVVLLGRVDGMDAIGARKAPPAEPTYVYSCAPVTGNVSPVGRLKTALLAQTKIAG